MKKDRRLFIKQASLGIAASPLLLSSCNGGESGDSIETKETAFSELNHVLKTPVLKQELFNSPVIIESVELLNYQDNYICRVRSTDGAVGLSVSNNMQMSSLFPIFINRIQPVFIGKDAVQLEQLIEEAYVFKSNYKLQSLAIWVPLATLEFAILDMLGHIAGKSIGELIGTIYNPEVAVYQANNHRGESAEKSIELIKKTQAKTGANAVKFKIGGRMSRSDSPEGRTEKLIPMVREAFGPDMTIYADSNGSYNVEEAIRIGRILEENAIDFYEEPVPFDWYEETRTVANNLNIPIAGGEQEPSMRNFQWLIHHDALDIVQPDIFYFGGMIRSIKVAQMANTRKKICIPHISGSGLGYLYMMQFVSAIPNAGPYHEFKGLNKKIPLNCPTSDLKVKEGKIKVPEGPGLGVEIDPEFVNKHKLVKL